jgi:hypothetical protein
MAEFRDPVRLIVPALALGGAMAALALGRDGAGVWLFGAAVLIAVGAGVALAGQRRSALFVARPFSVVAALPARIGGTAASLGSNLLGRASPSAGLARLPNRNAAEAASLSGDPAILPVDDRDRDLLVHVLSDAPGAADRIGSKARP